MKIQLLLGGLALARADIPAHCLQADVEGEWTFELAAPAADGDHDALRTSCAFDGAPVETLALTLAPEALATTPAGKDGFWTMVYDQGFEVAIGGRSFFHFMHYESNATATTTDCGRSLADFGWYHDVAAPGLAPAKFGCYRATKKTDVAPRVVERARHGSGRLGGVPRSAQWLADAPRARRDERPDAVKVRTKLAAGSFPPQLQRRPPVLFD